MADTTIQGFNKLIVAQREAIVKNNKATTENSKAINVLQQSLNKMSKTLNSVTGGIKAGTIAITGLGFGIRGLITTSFDLGKTVMGWHNAMNFLSDSTGSATSAVNLMTKAWGKTLGSLPEIQAAMGALANEGMHVSAEMENLTIFITNMSRATGLSADSLAKMTGHMVSFWNVSVTGSREMVSSVVAAQKAFNTTRNQMEQMIGVVSESIERIGPLFRDGEASAKALTKGIVMVSGALTKLGVTAKTANEFLSRMLDPERFSETNALMRMLGITFEEQMRMYEGAAGKELFFDKLLQNLPRLSRQIQAIQNPLARLQFAKAIGLPPEIAAKLSTASAGQMRGIIEEYRAQAQAEEAAAEKQRLAQANAAKFDEQLMFFKMKVLAPLMQWVMGPGYAFLMKLRTILAPAITWFVDGLTRVLNIVTTSIEPIITAFQTGDFGEAFKTALNNIGTGIKNLWVQKIQPAIKDVFIPFVKSLGSGLIEVVWEIIKEHKILALAIIGKPIMSFMVTMGAFVARMIIMQRMMTAAAGPGAVAPNLMGMIPGAGMLRGAGGRMAGAWRGMSRGGRAGLLIGGAIAAGTAISALSGSRRETEETPEDRRGVGALEIGQGATMLGGAAMKAGLITGTKAIPIIGWVLTAIMAVRDAIKGAAGVGQEINRITGRVTAITNRQRTELTNLRRAALIRALSPEERERLISLENTLIRQTSATTSEKIIGGLLNAVTLGLAEPSTIARWTIAIKTFLMGSADLINRDRLTALQSKAKAARGGAGPAMTEAEFNEMSQLEDTRSGIKKWWDQVGEEFSFEADIAGTVMTLGINKLVDVRAAWHRYIITTEEKQTLERTKKLLEAHKRGEVTLTNERVRQLQQTVTRLSSMQQRVSLTLEEEMSGMLSRIVNVFVDMPDAAPRISAWWNGFKSAFWEFIDGIGTMVSQSGTFLSKLLTSRGDFGAAMQAAIDAENRGPSVDRGLLLYSGQEMEDIAAGRRSDMNINELIRLLTQSRDASAANSTIRFALEAKLQQAERYRLMATARAEEGATAESRSEERRHRQTLNALGGIGAGINEVAGNTRPRTGSGQDFLTAFIGGGGLMGIARGSSV